MTPRNVSTPDAVGGFDMDTVQGPTHASKREYRLHAHSRVRPREDILGIEGLRAGQRVFINDVEDNPSLNGRSARLQSAGEGGRVLVRMEGEKEEEYIAIGLNHLSLDMGDLAYQNIVHFCEKNGIPRAFSREVLGPSPLQPSDTERWMEISNDQKELEKTCGSVMRRWARASDQEREGYQWMDNEEERNILTPESVEYPTHMPTGLPERVKSGPSCVAKGWRWRWEDHGGIIEIYIPVDDTTHPSDIAFKYTRGAVSLSIGNKAVFDLDQFYAPVRMGDAGWVLDFDPGSGQRAIILTFAKADASPSIRVMDNEAPNPEEDEIADFDDEDDEDIDSPMDRWSGDARGGRSRSWPVCFKADLEHDDKTQEVNALIEAAEKQDTAFQMRQAQEARQRALGTRGQAEEDSEKIPDIVPGAITGDPSRNRTRIEWDWEQEGDEVAIVAPLPKDVTAKDIEMHVGVLYGNGTRLSVTINPKEEGGGKRILFDSEELWGLVDAEDSTFSVEERNGVKVLILTIVKLDKNQPWPSCFRNLENPEDERISDAAGKKARRMRETDAEGYKWRWEQDQNEVRVYVPVTQDLDMDDVKYQISALGLELKIKDAPVFSDITFQYPVKAEESYILLGPDPLSPKDRPRCLIVVLMKLDRGVKWDHGLLKRSGSASGNIRGGGELGRLPPTVNSLTQELLKDALINFEGMEGVAAMRAVPLLEIVTRENTLEATMWLDKPIVDSLEELLRKFPRVGILPSGGYRGARRQRVLFGQKRDWILWMALPRFIGAVEVYPKDDKQGVFEGIEASMLTKDLMALGIHKNQLGDILINSAKDRLQIFCIPDAIIPVCERLRTVNNVPVSCRTVDLDFEFMKEDRFDRSKYSSEDYDN
ncbi:hypothetical protein AAMO2058_000794500 [Amorphochlora amoebiformis]